MDRTKVLPLPSQFDELLHYVVERATLFHLSTQCFPIYLMKILPTGMGRHVRPRAAKQHCSGNLKRA